MVTVALIGAGKMGISHLSILGAHPDVNVVGVSDTSPMVLDVLGKHSPFRCYKDYAAMIEKEKPEAVFVAVPTKFHADIVKSLVRRKIHVFVEKPLSLTAAESKDLVDLARENGVVNQVGYHNKFIGTFQEVARLLKNNALGDIHHFVGESYGPVVIRAKQETWRSDPKEGGGCLMDYASHVIDLLNYVVGPIDAVKGAILKSFYSRNVEDGVFSLLELGSGVSGMLSVNWSDDTYRKMSTSLTILGSKGKIITDANELKVHFKTDDCPEGYTKGWNIKYVTELSPQVDFYLRGEEYSAQIDHFVKAVQKQIPNTINNFESAWNTDRVISLIQQTSRSK
jgi:predicted dehydrogenase